MFIKALADRGIALADAIPDSLVALIARLAVGGVFWRSGQTKIEGFHIKDSTFWGEGERRGGNRREKK